MKSTMKYQAAIVAALLSMSTIAFAGGNSNNNDVTNNYDNRNYSTTTNGGQGGAGGHGTGIGVGIGQGGNATGGNASVIGSGNSSANSSVKSDIKNTNLNAQQQGQLQGQQQGQTQTSKSNAQQSQSANNEGVKTSVNVAGDVYEARDIPVSSAYAPNVMPTAVCALSASGGLSVANFSLSGGGTWIDDNCVLLEQVRRANEIGQREIAAEMMMDVPAFANAARRVADRKAAQAAAKPVAVAPVAVAQPAPAVVASGKPVVQSDARRFSDNEVEVVKRRLGLIP